MSRWVLSLSSFQLVNQSEERRVSETGTEFEETGAKAG